MSIFTEKLVENKKIKEIINILNGKQSRNLSLNGMTDSAKAMFLYAFTASSAKNSVIVCSNNFQATKIMQDLKFFCDIEVIYFPAKKFEYYDLTAQSNEIEASRVYAIKRILSGGKNIVITTIDALQSKMFSIDRYRDNDLVLSINDKIDIKNFTDKLVNLGYERSESVEGKGQFSIRGGIIDVFPVDSDNPYRLELFGDDIESIRSFDIFSQRSIDNAKQFNLSCVSEEKISQDEKKEVLYSLNEFVREDIPDELKNTIYEDIDKIENNMLDNMNEKYFELLGIENYTFLDYVKDYNIFIDEPYKCFEKADNVYKENYEVLKILSERNYIHIPFAHKYEKLEFVQDKLKNFNTIYLERINIDSIINKNRIVYDFDIQESNFYRNQMEALPSDVISQKSKGINVILVYPTKARVDQVKSYLEDNKIKMEYFDDIHLVKSFKADNVYITNAPLSSGFKTNELGINILVEPVSGTVVKSKKLKKTSIGQKINSFDDLKIGDYVVHEDHGIGIYKGVKTIEVQGVQKDYIVIEYEKNGMLYVPIVSLDLVTKYVCNDDTVPKINSLSSKDWSKTRHKVVAHVKEIAKELMLLYAKRENATGFAYQKDTTWQREFEDSFEYELTDDQKNSVAEIKEDMEKDKPMDRLLCGDVGYGKTEVALRAAFKAVVNKKQVAYLVPTTVLALQQYRTFKSRMESFGVRVELLSRMKTPKEQTQILKDLVDGKVDVIVGTHRLLSKDVFFSDLGLLIIDEEHRFGVKAKESIKILKESVDVLSMTATPIPRTLHMSMIGIRQMSTLSEPPLERLPVHTYVSEYNEEMIKSAIEKELLRDGQVFYINNRVNNIDEIAEKVRKLVPEARVAFAHGQMEPRKIEDIMIKFMNHEIDVIVCTTILESGIDIPNANTIIIENADKLGLAQLYQIRGRVGRSSRVAYAYITYKKDKVMSEEAEKRLKAIRDFTEFGSGFKIALRDLEIRGAGNMLGREQHGHMAKVGYEMYLALLEKAILEEKKGASKASIEDMEKEVKIDLGVSAYISDDYIKDPIQKISMYQKISDIKSKEESLDVIDELIDRYGDIPNETENLIKIVEIRNTARKLGITSIVATSNQLKLQPGDVKINIASSNSNDILIRTQLQLDKLVKVFDKNNENQEIVPKK